MFVCMHVHMYEYVRMSEYVCRSVRAFIRCVCCTILTGRCRSVFSVVVLIVEGGEGYKFEGRLRNHSIITWRDAVIHNPRPSTGVRGHTFRHSVGSLLLTLTLPGIQPVDGWNERHLMPLSQLTESVI